MDDLKIEQEFAGFGGDMVAWCDCPECEGTGVIYATQWEGDPGVPFSYPILCDCVFELD